MKVIHRMSREQYNRGRKSEEVMGEAMSGTQIGRRHGRVGRHEAFYGESVETASVVWADLL